MARPSVLIVGAGLAGLAAGAAEQLAGDLSFFGLGRARLIASHSISWEDDPWARGAYAFFDSSFPPTARRLLALPWKRVFFAGEHTSTTWQNTESRLPSSFRFTPTAQN